MMSGTVLLLLLFATAMAITDVKVHERDYNASVDYQKMLYAYVMNNNDPNTGPWSAAGQVLRVQLQFDIYSITSLDSVAEALTYTRVMYTVGHLIVIC